MSRERSSAMLPALILFISCLGTAASAQNPPPPTPQQRADMLRQWMASSEAQLRHYQWMSETVITVDGDKKSDEKDRCFYGPEGMVQKVSLGNSVEQGSGLPGILPPGRLIKMIEEHKQEEMKTYINNTVTLLHSYVPPNSTAIQAAIAAGGMSVNVLEPGAKVELVFNNFKQSGDKLGVVIELPTNRLLGLNVNTYLNTPDNPITMNATMGVMADGIIYTQTVDVQASAKNLEITVTNSDYQRISQ